MGVDGPFGRDGFLLRRRWNVRLRPTLRRRTPLTARLEALQVFLKCISD